MSDDSELPPVCTFTAISLKPLNPKHKDSPATSAKKSSARGSEPSRRNRKNLSDDDEGDDSEGSQELPLVCKNLEGLLTSL